MEGSAVEYKAIGYTERLELIKQHMLDEIKRLDSLPKEQAAKEAHDSLVELGLIDEEGNITEPYLALGRRYVQ